MAVVPVKAFWPIEVNSVGNVIVFSAPSLALGLLFASVVLKFTVFNCALLANAFIGILVRPAGKMTVSKFGMLLKVPQLSSTLLLLGQAPGVLAVITPVIPVPLKSILVNPLPWKAPLVSLFESLISVTLLGIAIDVKLVAPAKVAAGTFFNPLGKVTLLKLAAPWKTPLPRKPGS